MEKISKFSYLEIGGLLIALVLASVYGNNDMVFRVAVPSLFLAISIISLLIRVLVQNAQFTGLSGGIVYSLILLYFVFRALLSDGESMSEQDLVLLLSALLAGLLMFEKVNRDIFLKILPWLSVGLILIHSIPLLAQLKDPSYVPFRDAIKGKLYISGFFGHQNFFAAQMGVFASILVAYIMFATPFRIKTLLSFITKPIWILFSIYAVYLVYLSNSRGALVATLFAIGLSVTIGLCTKLFYNPKKKSIYVIGICIALFISTIGGFFTANSIAANRGLTSFFFQNSRQDLLLLSADSIPENRIVGGGARFYKFEARKVWDTDRMNNTLGDPVVVHNEYIEALVNYGYIGLAALLLLFVIVFSSSISSFSQKIAAVKRNTSKRSDLLPCFLIIPIILLIGIISLVDFALHILPILMIFSILSGIAFTSIGSNVMSRSKVQTLTWACLLFIPLSLLLYKTNPYWSGTLQYEKAMISKKESPLTAATRFVTVGENAGDSRSLKIAGDIYFSKAIYSSPSDIKYLEKALSAFETAAELSPNDGILESAKARVNLYLGNNITAKQNALTAWELLGASESRYHAKYLLGIAKYKLFLSKLEDVKYRNSQTIQQITEAYADFSALIIRDDFNFYVPRGTFPHIDTEIHAFYTLYDSYEKFIKSETYKKNRDFTKELEIIKDAKATLSRRISFFSDKKEKQFANNLLTSLKERSLSLEKLANRQNAQ